MEDCSDTSKNGLSDKRLHVHGDKQVNGKLFVMFVALILRRTFHRRLVEYLKEKGMTDEAAIRELEEIKFYKGKNGWCQKDAISKTQREILTALDLKLTMLPILRILSQQGIKTLYFCDVIKELKCNKGLAI